MAQRKPSRRKRSSSYQPKRRREPAKSRSAPGPSRLLEQQTAWDHFRALPVIVLVLVTIIAYANAWPDALVWDDTRFALSDRFSGLGLKGVVNFFTEDLWAVEGLRSGLYRPLLLVSIMLDTRLFGDWAAGYHLINILLHVLTTLLVYGFVRYLLSREQNPSSRSGYIALLAALVFAVHPVHAEAVNSIFNRSEILVSLGVVGGLWWFLSTRESQPGKAWFGLSLIYLLVLLCRESGVILPALAVALLWFTLPGNWLLRLRKCIPAVVLLIPLAIYLLLRAHALAPAAVPGETAAAATEQVSELTQLAEDTPAVSEDTGGPATEQQEQLTQLAETAPAVSEAAEAAATGPAGGPGLEAEDQPGVAADRQVTAAEPKSELTPEAEDEPALSDDSGTPARQKTAAPTPGAETVPAVAEDAVAGTAEPPPQSDAEQTPSADRFGMLSMVFTTLQNYNLGRLIKAVRIGADALKIMVWPHPLQLYHGEPETGLWLAMTLQLTLLAAAVAGYIYQRPDLITGLSFFYIALLPSTGILVADKYELAERFLYLPSVGLAIVLAFGLRWLARRFTLRTATVSMVIVTVALTPLTWARNADWASTIRLAEADYQKGVRNDLILRSLVQHNLEAGNYSRAVEVCDQQPEAVRISISLNNFCGSAYERVGRYDDAEKTFLLALSSHQGTSMVRFALASMYLRQGRRDDAEKFFNAGIAVKKVPSHKEFLTGFMLTELYPRDRAKLLEARAHFEKALELQPQFFQARQMLNELNQRLASK